MLFRTIYLVCLLTAVPPLVLNAQAQMRAKGTFGSAPSVYDGVADPGAVITEGHVRFTVLTPQLIRLEWVGDGQFEDRPSFTFLNRHLPVPPIRTSHDGNVLTIETSALSLHYTGDGSSKLTADNLSISLTLNDKQIVWRPGAPDTGNLLGTTRTLDRVVGDQLPEPLGSGLISRDGWSLIDDTTQPLFTSDNFSFTSGKKSAWPWVVRRTPSERQDWYFFGYGHNYKQALEDFRKVSGPVPLPPRWAFGAWWTRYWSYTDQDFDDLVRDYNKDDLPLDVLVIDMGWHVSRQQLLAMNAADQSGQKQFGWTGYTWNKMLFPYPEDFLQKMHRERLKVTLNLHPASGVQPYEVPYPQMARAMGIDPATKKYIPFDILNQKFAQNYMDLLHHPLEKQGVDFWWLDWQQATTNTPGVNSTWWLSYVHFTDQQREGKRPLLLGRYGGLGDQRYQAGFSGDVVGGWASLAFQPYFTATAANVAYAYWSHDIGGHLPGPDEPELYTRWVQFGTFSPILRTHAAINPYSERRIWAFPEPYSDVMRQAFHMRYAMLPYLYTEGRRTYDTGIAFLRPLYYEWPEASQAYSYKDEYLFGGEIIAAPVVAPADHVTKLAKQRVWIPEGEWIEYTSGKHFTGPLEVERQFAINEVPLYLKAGAILPMAPPMLRTTAKPVDPLILEVYPKPTGQESSYNLYADGSDSENYQHGEDAWTKIAAKQRGSETTVHIAAEEGQYPGMLQQRGYKICLPGDWPPQSVTANGQALTFQRFEGKPGWRYDGNKLMTIITVPRFSVHTAVDVRVRIAPDLVSQRWKLNGLQGLLARLRGTALTMMQNQGITFPPDVLNDAFQTGDRLTYHPETARDEVDHLLSIYPKILPAIQLAQKDSQSHINGQVTRSIPDEKSEAFRLRAGEYSDRLVESVADVEDSQSDLPAQK